MYRSVQIFVNDSSVLKRQIDDARIINRVMFKLGDSPSIYAHQLTPIFPFIVN